MGDRLAYRAHEAAALLGVSERHVWRLIARDELPTVKLGNARLIPKIALEQLVGAPASTVATAPTGPTVDGDAPPTSTAAAGEVAADQAAARPAAVAGISTL